MATFVKHESCPRCGSRDNLARYSDGGAFCFGCRYSEKRTGYAFKANTISDDLSAEEQKAIALPEDCSTAYPSSVTGYLAKYDLSVVEALRLGALWSGARQQLIYPYYATNHDTGERYLACYQARNFHQQVSGPKYVNKGKTTDVIPIITYVAGSSGGIRGTRLVITEDALSALKVARQCDAMPALGTNVPVSKLNAIARQYTRLTVWLDSDKWREARHIADNFKWLGLSADTIYSELDPKCYSDEQIKEYLK
jgi:hypothetical protein